MTRFFFETIKKYEKKPANNTLAIPYKYFKYISYNNEWNNQ